MNNTNLSNNALRIKREILVRLIEAFYTDNFEENARLIPFDMRPKGCEVTYRCCVYKERAAIRNRTMAYLGVAIEDDTEREPIEAYARIAQSREKPDSHVLTVVESACQGCQPNAMYVTDLCQSCVARPCFNTCRFSAITFENGRSSIDPNKCRMCGMCMKVCPYQAIVKRIVPCENVCPVGAIAKGPSGYAKIDFDKCISCGKCVAFCPFGAVHEKSQIIDVLARMRQGRKVVALLSPASAGQFPCTLLQINTALRMVGFHDVMEVAYGADITARNEAEDFKERMERGDKFMTTSCCASYNELTKKHLNELKPFVSETKTPLFYTAEEAKRRYPDAVTVFFSPCVAKRKEASDNDNVDYVLTFEEMGALMIAFKIQVAKCDETPFDYNSSKQARRFPVIGGVAESVRAALGDDAGMLRPVIIQGLDKQSVRDLKKYAKDGCCPDGNLIEVMSCPGGCISGNAVINSIKTALKKVNDYSGEGPEL